MFVPIAAILGALAVGMGAFGAHGLADRVPAADLVIWDTAVKYHMYHTLAMLAVALVPLAQRRRFAQCACWAWLGGILIFSGSLYILVLSGMRWLGAITPIGGVALIIGWLLLLPGQKREA